MSSSASAFVCVLVLRPISTSANLILNKDEQNQIPLIVANVVMEELEILFSRQQVEKLIPFDC